MYEDNKTQNAKFFFIKVGMRISKITWFYLTLCLVALTTVAKLVLFIYLLFVCFLRPSEISALLMQNPVAFWFPLTGSSKKLLQNCLSRFAPAAPSTSPKSKKGFLQHLMLWICMNFFCNFFLWSVTFSTYIGSIFTVDWREPFSSGDSVTMRRKSAKAHIVSSTYIISG